VVCAHVPEGGAVRVLPYLPITPLALASQKSMYYSLSVFIRSRQLSTERALEVIHVTPRRDPSMSSSMPGVGGGVLFIPLMADPRNKNGASY
jgi:hypothetical protein